MPVDEAALDAFLADPATPGGDLNPTGTAPVATPAAPVAAETPAAPAAPAASQADVEHAIPDALPEGETFPREYVEKIRRESAGYRDRAKKFNDTFDAYEAEAVDEWLRLAATLQQDPKAAAAEFARLAEEINKEFGAEAVAEVLDGTPDAALAPEAPLTRKELEAFYAEKQREADVSNRVKQIELDARALGYEKGSDSYDELLWTATRVPGGSVQAAHEKIEARNKAILDAHLAKLGQAPNPQVPVPGAPVSQERALNTFEDANKALDAWLATQA